MNLKISAVFYALILLYSCNSQTSQEKQDGRSGITKIEQSDKYQRGINAFPFILSADDTINLEEALNVQASLNSKMFKDIADIENLEISYFIFANNKGAWTAEKSIEPHETMDFELKFDTLNITKDSAHIWTFGSKVEFYRDGKLFYDTSAIAQNRVFISK